MSVTWGGGQDEPNPAPAPLSAWPEAYRNAPLGFTNDPTVGGANFTAEEKAQLKARMGIK